MPKIRLNNVAIYSQISRNSPQLRTLKGPRSLPEVSCLRLLGVGPGHETETESHRYSSDILLLDESNQRCAGCLIQVQPV